jgi:uncharacterized Zn finger protein
MTPEIYIPKSAALPDKNQWTNRFEIHSESSDRVYVIAQHKDLKHWGCSCPAWRVHRKCKHLASVGVPNYEKPFVVIVKTR